MITFADSNLVQKNRFFSAPKMWALATFLHPGHWPDGALGHESPLSSLFFLFWAPIQCPGPAWVVSIMILEVDGKGPATQKLAAEPLWLIPLRSPSGRTSWLLLTRDYCGSKRLGDLPRRGSPDWESWWNIRQLNNTSFSSAGKLIFRKYSMKFELKKILAWFTTKLFTDNFEVP